MDFQESWQMKIRIEEGTEKEFSVLDLVCWIAVGIVVVAFGLFMCTH